MRLSHLLPAALLATASAQSSNSTQHTTYEAISQTLNTYPIAVDFKRADLFPKIFTENVFANYTGYLSNVTGLNNFTEALLLSVSSLITQHQLGTTLIDIANSSYANSTTYFTANLVSIAPATQGSFSILFGLYRDTLVGTQQGWRINTRYLEFMTPNIGNLTQG